MSFTSFVFLAFIVAIVAIYYMVPKKFQWAFLLLASYVFYLSSGIPQVVYILFTTLFTYLAGRLMQKIRDDNRKKVEAMGDGVSREEKREFSKQAAKRVHTVQVITVLVNLGVLAGVKCLNLLLDSINSVFDLFHWDASMPLINIIVPLGLSYYTFNSIGYLIDIGRGKYEAEKHIGKFALFVSFFPSIVQGPLFRYCDVGYQLNAPHKFDFDNVKHGAQLILWGFFKKLVIADRVAAAALTVFSPGFEWSNGSQIFFGVLAYSFQIYGDFSGGTDITRGVAQMMGIDLPVNFERPFFATSMADFWRRWHMSLGAWMREFVFFPVMLSKPVTNLSKRFRKRWGGYAGKMVPSVAAPFVVFFLIGIWHGVTWQYVTNGLYNATLIAGSVALAPVYKWLIEKLKINVETFGFRLFQILRTFTLLCISRVIVKAPNLGTAFRMIKSMFTSIDLKFLTGANGEIFTYGVDKKDMLILFVAIFILFIIGILQERGVKIRESLDKMNIIFRWGLIFILFIFVIVFGVYGPEYDASAFIYGRF